MADNFTANAGSGGATFASDDVGGVQYPRVKPSWGADGSATDASVAAPLPTQASAESNQMFASGTAVTPKYAVIAPSTAGNTTIVAAVASRKLRVLSLAMMSSGAVNVKFQSGSGGTDLTGLFPLAANTGAALPYNPVGWFETGSAGLLNANLSASSYVGGCLTYIEVST